MTDQTGHFMLLFAPPMLYPVRQAEDKSSNGKHMCRIKRSFKI